MSSGQVTNSIDTAPTGMLDMQAGGSTNAAFSSLQNEFISHAMDRNTATGGFLGGADDAVADGLHELDEGEAKIIGGDKAMPVTPASQVANNDVGNSALIVSEGSKKYLDIPNPATDIYNTPAANAAFNRLFDPKKATAAA